MDKTVEDLAFEAGVYAGKLIQGGMDKNEAKRRAACKIAAEGFGIRLADCPEEIWEGYIQKLKAESKKKNTEEIKVMDEVEITTPGNSFRDDERLQRMVMFAIRKKEK